MEAAGVMDNKDGLWHDYAAGTAAPFAREFLFTMMQWVCFALRPLSLKDLHLAIAVDARVPQNVLGEYRIAQESAYTDEQMNQNEPMIYPEALLKSTRLVTNKSHNLCIGLSAILSFKAA